MSDLDKFFADGGTEKNIVQAIDIQATNDFRISGAPGSIFAIRIFVAEEAGFTPRLQPKGSTYLVWFLKIEEGFRFFNTKNQAVSHAVIRGLESKVILSEVFIIIMKEYI